MTLVVFTTITTIIYIYIIVTLPILITIFQHNTHCVLLLWYCCQQKFAVATGVHHNALVGG